ncbi:unnamed protein product [Rotaria magnacalcarata]|uniref:THAP9-like helix-turn-helix domain-containing protein n=1 Tax=Rotaria magnacalcarata TaxID=392030 RepID=A0A816L044_9BILA|nr:unnamed protein product [Rotaria magnacalcarata]
MTDCAENFLNTTDIFEIFKYDSEELDEIKHQSCYKLKNGDYIVRTGVKNNMNYLKEIFVKKLEEHRISSSSFQQDISKELMNKNPLLRSLITWYSHNANVLKNINVNNSHNNNNNDNSSSNNNSSINNLFISSFIDTIANNIVKSKQGQCYDDSMKKFAILLYTFGGKLAYQLVRINIIGALPSLSTLSRLMSNTDTIITEGRFRIMALKQYTDSLNAKFGFCSEDCTGVIKKIKYDVTTNSFVGFVTKFSNGIPIPEYYKTDSYEQLKAWFTNIKKSNLLNIFMFQPLPPPGHSNTPSPFLMNAFGADGTGSAMEILYRWVHVFEYSLENQIRIIGFSTDGDNKYMRATRLMAGFFASLSKFLPYEHPDVFQIKLKYGWPWFYLRKQQLFLFFQDPTHLVTKWRNRLLSRTADLHIGDEIISMDHIRSIVKNSKYTKLDHGLTRSDLNPKDRQNYRSCVKLTSEDLSRILIEDENCLGTHVYLQVLKMIIKAYIEKSTTIVKRLEMAWCTVFVCRLWRAWLQHISLKHEPRTTNNSNAATKQNYFITKTAYLSVEINAQMLLYLVVLVKEKQLPKEALNIYLFNSQSCESMFRNARALSGVFSTIVNFTVSDFLRRSQKLSLLNQIKHEQIDNSQKKITISCTS